MATRINFLRDFDAVKFFSKLGLVSGGIGAIYNSRKGFKDTETDILINDKKHFLSPDNVRFVNTVTSTGIGFGMDILLDFYRQ